MTTHQQSLPQAAISAEHLVRRFGNFTAVNDVSFRVEKGEIFGFLGPNGSGKTTVIKMLTGLLPLSGGSARVEGLDVRTAGIDPVARRQLWDLLFELSGHGITFFVTTHYMDEAERCSHVAYIYFGKVIADGTPEALKAMPEVNPSGTRRMEITAPDITHALRLAREIPGIVSATVFGQWIHALVEDRL